MKPILKELRMPLTSEYKPSEKDLENAKKYAPYKSEKNGVIKISFRRTNPEFKENNKKLPDFWGYATDADGWIFKIGGWINEKFDKETNKKTSSVNGELTPLGIKKADKPREENAVDEDIPF